MNEQERLTNSLYDIFRKYHPNETILKFYIDDILNEREISLDDLTMLLRSEENAKTAAKEVNELLGKNIVTGVIEESVNSETELEQLKAILSNPDYFINGVVADYLIKDVEAGEEIEFSRIMAMTRGDLELSTKINEIIEKIQGKKEEVKPGEIKSNVEKTLDGISFDGFNDFISFGDHYGLDHIISLKIQNELLKQNGLITLDDLENIWENKNIQSKILGDKTLSEKEKDVLKQQFLDDLEHFMKQLAESTIEIQRVAKKTEFDEIEKNYDNEVEEVELALLEDHMKEIAKLYRSLDEDGFSIEKYDKLQIQMGALMTTLNHYKNTFSLEKFNNLQSKSLKEDNEELTFREWLIKATKKLERYKNAKNLYENYLEKIKKSFGDIYSKSILLYNVEDLSEEEKNTIGNLMDVVKTLLLENGMSKENIGDLYNQAMLNKTKVDTDKALKDLLISCVSGIDAIADAEKDLNIVFKYGQLSDAMLKISEILKNRRQNKNLEDTKNKKKALIGDVASQISKISKKKDSNNLIDEADKLKDANPNSSKHETKGSNNPKIQISVEEEESIIDLLKKNDFFKPGDENDPKWQEFLVAAKNGISSINPPKKIQLQDAYFSRLHFLKRRRQRKNQEIAKEYNARTEKEAAWEKEYQVLESYKNTFGASEKEEKNLQAYNDLLEHLKEKTEEFLKANADLEKYVVKSAKLENLDEAKKDGSKKIKIPPTNGFEKEQQKTWWYKELENLKNLDNSELIEQAKKHEKIVDYVEAYDTTNGNLDPQLYKTLITCCKLYQDKFNNLSEKEKEDYNNMDYIISSIKKSDAGKLIRNDFKDFVIDDDSINTLKKIYNNQSLDDLFKAIDKTVVSLNEIYEYKKEMKNVNEHRNLKQKAITTFIDKNAENDFASVTEEQKIYLNSLKTGTTIEDAELAKYIEQKDPNHKLDIYFDKDGNIIQEEPLFEEPTLEETIKQAALNSYNKISTYEELKEYTEKLKNMKNSQQNVNNEVNIEQGRSK